jgi:hypothetical protein
MTGRWSFALGLAVGLVVASAARAASAEPQEVTIVAGPRAALAHRLTQELEASGIVVHVESGEPSRDAPALFVVVPEEEGAPIEIWSVKDGASTLVASVASEGPADTRVLRAAELARALAAPGPRTSPVAAPPEASPPAPIPAPSAPAALAPPSPFVPWSLQPPFRPKADEPAYVDFGLGVALGLQSQGASLQFEGSARFWPAERVGVGVFASAPATGATIRANEGTATLRAAIFGLELVTAPVTRTGPFAIVLSPGIALDYVNVSGEAETGFVSLGGDTLLVAAYGRAEARIAIAGPLRLALGAMGGASFTAVDITFADTVYSTYCPFGSASLGAVVEP